MATIRIDNATDDVLKIELDGKEYCISEDESLTVSPTEKGQHHLTVWRVRGSEIGENSIPGSDEPKQRFSKDEKSQYVRLKASYEINTVSSKSVWTVKQKPMLVEKTGVDALFSGSELIITGGSITESKQSFADKEVRKSYLKKQLMSAFFPIGVGILIFTVLAAFALAGNITGNPITLGGREFTYPWTFGLVAIDFGFVGYFTAMLINIFSTDKQYK